MRTICVLLVLASGIASASDSVLLEFGQPGCHACAAMQSTIRQLEQEGVAVRHIDASREQHLAQRYRVSAVPTYVVLSGGREVTRLQGSQPIEKLRNALVSRQKLRATGALTTQPLASQTRLASVSSSNPGTLDSAGLAAEAMPSMSLAAAIESAQAATVRIRVQENGGTGVATGTIIDTHGEEALVLTCGHVFRETKGQTPIEVEVFAHGQIHKLPGQLVDYDSETRDIGLVSIRPGFAVDPVPVVADIKSLASGTPAFSFGCDRGADPSRRDTRITAINKYNQHVGASNLEIAGAPTIGRSGGGLFDQQGRLIGVCNAADFEDDIGIYAGPGNIKWQLDRVDLAHLYQPRQAAPPAPTRLAVASPKTFDADSIMKTAVQTTPAMNTTGNEEVIVIVRDKSRPNAPPQIKTFDQPPVEIMRLLGRR